jgi:L-asparaginase II
MAALMIRLMKLDRGERALLDRFARPAMSNWKGIEVGRLRPTEAVLPK